MMYQCLTNNYRTPVYDTLYLALFDAMAKTKARNMSACAVNVEKIGCVEFVIHASNAFYQKYTRAEAKSYIAANSPVAP